MELNWSSAKKELPKTEGFYLCATKQGLIRIYPFAKCLKDVDDFEFENVDRAGFYCDTPNGLCEIDVRFWSPLPEAPSERS